jgi:glycosyltransferase involved in cell wall biosynthesis
VRSSSSGDLERSLISAHINLRGRFHAVGHVTGESRAWLLQKAAAVLYPTSAEGFGFVPYEAAALGTPTTFTAFGPLYEVSHLDSVPQSWTVDAYATDLLKLLSDEDSSRQRVVELSAALERLTWDNFARELASFFSHIRSLPQASPIWPLTTIGATRAAASASHADRVVGVLKSARRRFLRSRH